MTTEYDELKADIVALRQSFDAHLQQHGGGVSPSPAAVRTYTVQSSDGGGGLSAIAQAQLGDASRWPEIAALNNVPGPDYVIYPGQVLQLPS